jgi:ribosome-binding protein aMBF1 (putative translation factor)
VPWQVEILDEIVAAAIAALPADSDGQKGRRSSRFREKDAKDTARRDRAGVAPSKGHQMTIQFEKLKARLLANPKVKAEYDALAPEFEIAAELLRARLRAGLSQAELAERMGTSQSTIARLENGQTLPSTKTILRYAEATGSRLRVRLSAA